MDELTVVATCQRFRSEVRFPSDQVIVFLGRDKDWIEFKCPACMGEHSKTLRHPSILMMLLEAEPVVHIADPPQVESP